jgi:serine/threonine protein kinase
VTPAQWERLKDVFQAALEQPALARAAWLAQHCADDPAIRREAEALLQTHETAGDFLEQPANIDPDDLETLLPGTMVGPYKVIEEIGRGGMGVVYLAEDTRLGRQVALKALPSAMAMQPELRQRLRREARAAATISHPCVAVVYALEEVGDHLFIASEYVRGETLRTEIARGPMLPDRARGIAADIARALAAAHDAGVIHRDLKPENVLIKPDGGVKVVDFGIAQIEGPEATRLTRAGAMLGTPAYMAPEQLLGASVDGRADIYAWGVVLSEMLVGRHPLQGHSGKRSTVSGPFATIISRCLQPDPTARYATARELVEALGTELGGEL